MVDQSLLFDMNLCKMRALLKGEQRRIKAMLDQIEKAKSADDLAYAEQGFELSANSMKMGQRLCQEVME